MTKELHKKTRIEDGQTQQEPSSVEVLGGQQSVVRVRKSRTTDASRDERSRLVVSEPQMTRGVVVEPGFIQGLSDARRRHALTRNQIDAPNELWTDYNSSVEAIESESFGRVLPEGLVKLVQGKEGLVVVDLMAPSGTVADLFSQLPPDTERRGITVALRDYRKEEEKKRDEALGITQMRGDLAYSKTWRAVEAELGERQADLIMERANGGHVYLPLHPQFYGYAAQRAWRMLSENGGVLLAEVPWHVKGFIRKHNWEERVAEQGIDVAVDYNPSVDRAVVRLTKHPDSPAVLPDVR